MTNPSSISLMNDPVVKSLDPPFFGRLWLTAGVVGLSGTPIVYFFRHSQPWIAAIPIALGLVVFVVIESRRGTWSDLWHTMLLDEIDALHQARNLAQQLRETRSSVLVGFTPSPSSAYGQLDLFEKRVAAITEDQKGLSFIRSELGQEFAFVTWHRFEELLLSEVMPDIDRATDSAFASALKHAPAAVARELGELLDKEAREIMKQDFRTSSVSLIAEATRRVALRLDAEASAVAHAKNPTLRKRKAKPKHP